MMKKTLIVTTIALTIFSSMANAKIIKLSKHRYISDNQIIGLVPVNKNKCALAYKTIGNASYGVLFNSDCQSLADGLNDPNAEPDLSSFFIEEHALTNVLGLNPGN